MSYTNGLDDPSKYTQTALYTGNGSTQSITNDGNSNLQPDWVWINDRNYDSSQSLFDSVRGTSKRLKSDTNEAEVTASGVTSFDTDGFTLGSHGAANANTTTYVGWQWKKSATAGFDIVTYTGNQTARTISHNLGAVPKMMIVKNRGTTGNWGVYHVGLGTANKRLELDSFAAADTGTSVWNDTDPTSSVFSVGNNDRITNGNGMTYVAYLFAEKKGYSKIGSYTGNGNANGNFNYLGFRPSLIILKGNNTENWSMYDNKRLGYNVDNNVLYPNTNSTEGTSDDIDLLSNGFKIRRQTGLLNDSGVLYIYMAFAESPFVTSSAIPTTSR